MKQSIAGKNRWYRTAAILAAVALASCTTAEVARRGPGFKVYEVGNPADVVRPTRGLWVLQGGGDDVDQNYIRMGEFGGGGDFVVLRASGKDDYNDYIYGLCHCDSVTTLVFDGGAAMSDPWVIETIRNAEAIFIAGGDQSNYIRHWKDTPVEDAINFVVAKPAPIGGTSAGMAILGEFVYSAEGKKSLTSAVAMSNPFAPDLTLARDFLHLSGLENVITDQHLQERDRIGRTVTLLARLQKDGWSAAPRAIAADRETSVHVDPADGSARVFSTADHPTPYAYFMRAAKAPEHCEPDQPLTSGPVEVYRIGPGEGRFDLAAWKGTGGISYELRVRAGALVSSRGDAY
jgi:cyanophycinase-like exopeptidase